jgi:hypothetical protein
MYTTDSAVLFLVFNRPSTTELVFDAIRKAKPKKLYIAADGARSGNIEDENNSKKVKEIVSNIDWDCEVNTLYRTANLGCKYAISGAIDWFFEKEVQGIILEDDCLPSPDFFRFCDTMLNHYAEDTRIRFVAGSNFQKGIQRSEASYYFSNLSHVWGWASWRRAWKDYDVELRHYKENDNYNSFLTVFNNEFLAQDWKDIIDKLHAKEYDTWDYQWAITNMFQHGLSVMPNVNLISNIGFGQEATHTFVSNGFENLPFGNLDKAIKHPTVFLPSKEADFSTLSVEHNIAYRTKKLKKKQFYKRVKFWKK